MLIRLAIGFGVGGILGAFYFGVLWLTVRRIPDADRPGLLVATSYAGRLGALGLGFGSVVWIGGGPALVGALLGLLTARRLMLARIGLGSGAEAEVGSLASPAAPVIAGSPEDASDPKAGT